MQNFYDKFSTAHMHNACAMARYRRKRSCWNFLPQRRCSLLRNIPKLQP